jgi:hypothetical protein
MPMDTNKSVHQLVLQLIVTMRKACFIKVTETCPFEYLQELTAGRVNQVKIGDEIRQI